MNQIMESFAEWLEQELNTRGWPRSEAARRGGVSESMFAKVIGGYANPGLEFCIGVARAFNMRPEDVMRKAGLLPPEPESSPRLQDLVFIASKLPSADLDRLVTVARALYEQSQAEKTKRPHPGRVSS